MNTTPTTITPPPVPPAPGNKDERMWAMLCHLTGLLGWIGPLVIWLIKKEEFPLVNDQGKESLNFQITMVIGWLIGSVLIPVFCIGTILLLAVGITNLAFVIIASMKANEGVQYRYPFAIRFIK